MARSAKATEILKVGQELLQKRGYGGFSFRDIADRVAIRSASIHYHFPTKEALVLAMTEDYRTAFRNAVADVEARDSHVLARLRGYADLFDTTLVRFDRVCLCGMLASESTILPDAVRVEVQGFFSEQHAWLERILREGVDAGELRADLDAASIARIYLSSLEGGMIIARSMAAPSDLRRVADQLLALIAE